MELPIREATIRALDERRIRDLSEAAGLTIQRVIRTHWRCLVIFNNGRFAYLPQAEGSVHYNFETLAEIGVLTGDELEHINQEAATLHAIRRDEYERAQYAKLKAKFEGGGND